MSGDPNGLDWECPGEAHILDGTFNPSTQGPYGPGYHDCEWCDNEYFITKDLYDEYFVYLQKLETARHLARLEAHREMEYQAVLTKLTTGPRSNVPM